MNFSEITTIDDDDFEITPECTMIELDEEEDEPMDIIHLSGSDLETDSEEEDDDEEEEEDLPEIMEGSIIEIEKKRVYIMNKIGEGVFGKVFHVCEENRRMAMKVQDFSDLDRRMHASKELRFLQLIESTGISKKNIVSFIRSSLHGSEHLLFFELMGESLEQYLSDMKPRTIREVQLIGYQLLTAIKHIHSIGIVHTDIKPTNILFPLDLKKGTVKLCDFGLALSKTELRHYRGQSVSPLMFRAPEVYLEIELNEKLDLFSLGCVLGEVYSGYQMFPANSIHQLNHFHTQLLGIPSNWKDGNYRKFFKLERSQIRCYTEVELLNMGFPFEKDERTLPIVRLTDIVNCGYNIMTKVQEKDHQFADLMMKIMDPNNCMRLDAATARRHPFFY